jgi:hypothetical protein
VRQGGRRRGRDCLHADGRTGCLLRCLTQVDRSDLEELQLHACCAVQLADTNLRAEIQASSIGEGPADGDGSEIIGQTLG